MDRPIDNNTYNLLQTLTSKLEAIEAYDKYIRDADSEVRSFFEEAKRSDEESVKRLVQLLGSRLPAREMAGTR